MTLWLIVLAAVAAVLLIKPVRNFLLSIVGRIRGFANEVMEELKKVSWPSRRELKSSTGLVIFSMILLAVFVGVIDVVLNAIVGLFVR